MQYIARQPIVNTQCRLQAYELLFRDSEENRCLADDADLASRKTMDTAVLMGLDTLSDGRTVFLNCTHNLIVHGFPTLFPPELTVIEVLESVQPTPEVIKACEELKSSGYRIALDDFVPQPAFDPLVALADIIKIDFRATTPELRTQFARQYAAKTRQLLAEKVETIEEFRSGIELGFTLFQGYFFAKPNVLSTKSVDGLNLNNLRILGALASPTLNFVELEEIIKSDPAICFRLFRFLNSPAFYLHSEIRSVLHALILLGELEIRKWLLLVCAVLAAKSSEPHLLSAALVRARFAELLGPETKLSSASLFILGLMSAMDVILNKPMAQMVDQIAVSSEIREALLGEPNQLRKCLDMILAYESADWTQCEELRKSLQIPTKSISTLYMEAVRWTKQLSLND